MADLFGPGIYSYSRSQALADGVLIDISDIAREAGFRWPVAVSARLCHDVLNPGHSLAARGQSLEGRIWDMLNVLWLASKSSPDTSRLTFSPLFVMAPDGPPIPITLITTVGPGDQGEPVLTIFLPEDD
jgi:hypothetical protein